MQTAQPSKTTIYQALDEWFVGKGFTITQLGKFMPGRKWERTEGERYIVIVCSPRTKTKYHGEISRMKYVGHELAIEINTPLHTRLTLNPVSSLSLGVVEKYLFRKMDVHPLRDPGEAYDYLKVNVHDEEWSREFLGLQEVEQRVREVLIPEDKPLGSVSFSLQPGTVYYRLRASLGDITPELLEKSLDSLEVVTDLAEACSPPSRRAERTRIENMGRENPLKLILMFFGAFIGLCVLLVLGLIGMIILGLENVFIYFVIASVIAFFVWRFVRGKK